MNAQQIEYKIEVHTSGSQKCVGTYAPGVTKEQVEARVRGSTGGYFQKFGEGRFVYIACTD